MSAQIAQRFAAIDHRSNGSYRVSLVYKLHPTLSLTPSPSSRSLSSPLPPHPPPSRRPAGRSREVGQLGFAVSLTGQPEPQGSRDSDTPSPLSRSAPRQISPPADMLLSSRSARGEGLGLGCLLFGLALTVAPMFALAPPPRPTTRCAHVPPPSLLAAPGSKSSAIAPVGWWIACRIWAASPVGIPALLVLGWWRRRFSLAGWF
jgi:hypothetical protein